MKKRKIILLSIIPAALLLGYGIYQAKAEGSIVSEQKQVSYLSKDELQFEADFNTYLRNTGKIKAIDKTARLEEVELKQKQETLAAKQEEVKEAVQEKEKQSSVVVPSTPQQTKPSTPVQSKPSVPPTQPKLVVETFKTLGVSQQVILVTASNYSTRQAKIETFEKTNGVWKQIHSMSGVLGKNGLSDTKHEGDYESPTGKYSIGTAFGRTGNPGTKLPYRQITSDDVWVDDSKSPLYNTWQSRSATQGQWTSAENMNISLYDVGFVINYNTARTPGKGSAIFFHIAGSSGYTAGCTATSRDNVIHIVRWLDLGKSPVIIQTPVSGLGNY
ncbi:L,D-transpeptidase family protein [Bacillus sp. 165]|uniref:L,D-transpeptidase family protein n=1 Tax=Bacillus sp. 165 TaxID=1529117 RepID=UPI001ADB0A7B|nr:L,D-transpeptidase family protein [Bacillus sp. 165]MBO9130998.1 L,D-transpeptidase family protein [Bacillus sp. 165]